MKGIVSVIHVCAWIAYGYVNEQFKTKEMCLIETFSDGVYLRSDIMLKFNTKQYIITNVCHFPGIIDYDFIIVVDKFI